MLGQAVISSSQRMNNFWAWGNGEKSGLNLLQVKLNGFALPNSSFLTSKTWTMNTPTWQGNWTELW